MKAYRTSVKIKLGLIVAAVLIAVASLWYTNALANRLMRQEREAIRLWARAQEYVTQVNAVNPHQDDFIRLEEMLEAPGLPLGEGQAADSLRQAIRWARSMPASDEINFVFNEIVEPQSRFNVPAIITDTSLSVVITSRNVEVDSSQTQEDIDADLLRAAAAYDAIHPPIRLDLGGGLDVQLIHYGESDTVRSLRWFPFWQFLFVGLFILVGYLGFSYVRRSEQSSLWVGMAKEAAHQLGTPISSIMGWVELLRVGGGVDNEQVAEELDKDVARLHRVADRFQKIGSVPTLEAQPLAPVVEGVADYVRRRMPSVGRRVRLSVDVPPDLWAALNRELFEWVVENLLKNALDAIEGSGEIRIRAYRTLPRTGRRGRSTVTLDVSDTGRGIDRSAARHIFRPGFSTKKRGWGLGLSLAKRIIEDYHGGTLGLAESKPGQGTTFRISLAEVEPMRHPDSAPSEHVLEA